MRSQPSPTRSRTRGQRTATGPMPAMIGELVGMVAEQGCNFGLDGLRQQCSRAVAQHLGQRISKSSWLAEWENVSLGHGVSLLRWRSGGVEHPHDTPPYPFMPSPTFAHSSSSAGPVLSHRTREEDRPGRAFGAVRQRDYFALLYSGFLLRALARFTSSSRLWRLQIRRDGPRQ